MNNILSGGWGWGKGGGVSSGVDAVTVGVQAVTSGVQAVTSGSFLTKLFLRATIFRITLQGVQGVQSGVQNSDGEDREDF